MKVADRLLLQFGPVFAAGIMRLLHLTIRRETLGEENLRQVWNRGERAIIAFWHDQLFLMVFGYPGKNARLLISASKDGELVARTMSFFGQNVVRGSSSKGGRAAFREMLNLGQEQTDLVLTPDGPKGPRHSLKDGVVQLARLTGRPVIPMAFVCSSGHRFKSWDRFLFPYPFCRGVYSFGEPVFYKKDEKVELFRQRLQDAIRVNQENAERRLETFGVSAV